MKLKNEVAREVNVKFVFGKTNGICRLSVIDQQAVSHYSIQDRLSVKSCKENEAKVLNE